MHHGQSGDDRHVLNDHGRRAFGTQIDPAITDDDRFRDAALALFRDYEASGTRLCSQAFLAGNAADFREHIVGISMQMNTVAKMAGVTKDPKYLHAAERLHELLVGRSMQASGIMAGNEFVHHAGPRRWTEHCGTVEWVISNAELVAMTGKAAYADAAERCMWNAYFGSKSADGMLLAYNHAPNQIAATNYTGPYEDNWDQAWFRAFYSAKHRFGCCNFNTSRAFPNFIQRAVMATPDGGAAIVFHGAWTASLNGYDLESMSEYPFEDRIRLTVHAAPESPAPLHLRIPGWCRGASITHNGKAIDIEASPGSFATIDELIASGD